MFLVVYFNTQQINSFVTEHNILTHTTRDRNVLNKSTFTVQASKRAFFFVYILTFLRMLFRPLSCSLNVLQSAALVSSWQPSFSYHSTVPSMGTASAL